MNVRAYDPEGMGQAVKLLDDVTYCTNAYDALEGASATVIVTEWDAFRALDFARMGEVLAEKLLVHLRNLYYRDEVERHGFRHIIVRGLVGRTDQKYHLQDQVSARAEPLVAQGSASQTLQGKTLIKSDSRPSRRGLVEKCPLRRAPSNKIVGPLHPAGRSDARARAPGGPRQGGDPAG